jgi:hypothetical protein
VAYHVLTATVIINLGEYQESVLQDFMALDKDMLLESIRTNFPAEGDTESITISSTVIRG